MCRLGKLVPQRILLVALHVKQYWFSPKAGKHRTMARVHEVEVCIRHCGRVVQLTRLEHQGAWSTRARARALTRHRHVGAFASITDRSCVSFGHALAFSDCACPHCVRMCSFRALVIFTHCLQNACRLSSLLFVSFWPYVAAARGQNQYVVTSLAFALPASCCGELRILLLGLFMAPGRRKRQRVPLTRSVHAKPRLLPNRSDVAHAYSSFFKTTPLCLCALPSPSLPSPSHPRGIQN